MSPLISIKFDMDDLELLQNILDNQRSKYCSSIKRLDNDATPEEKVFLDKTISNIKEKCNRIWDIQLRISKAKGYIIGRSA